MALKKYGGVGMSSSVIGLGYWNGGIKALKAFTTPQRNLEPLSCPEYEYEVVSDIEYVCLELLYSHEIYLDIIDSEILILANRDGYILAIKFDEIIEEDAAWLKKIISANTHLMILRDGKEVLKFLRKKKITVSGEYFDLMLAAKLLEYGNFQIKEFQDVISKYLPGRYLYQISSTEVEEKESVNKVINNFNIIFSLKDLLQQKIEEERMEDIAAIEFECLNAITELETAGVYLDTNLWNKVKKYNTQSVNYVKYVNPATNRIYSNFNQLGSSTGRIISGNPNIQNISRDSRIRSCFRAEEGNILILGDYSQLELRFVAEIANEDTMIEAFRECIDLHAFTASKVLNKSTTEVNSDQRHSAKAVNFGLIYGMGTEGLIKYANESFGVKLLKNEAESYKAKFFKAYPRIMEWHCLARRNNSNGVRTLGGRIRKWDTTPTMQSLTNSKIQGSAADMVKKALVNLIELRRFYNLKFHIVNVVHDEIIIEVSSNPENITKSKEILEKAMIEAGNYYLKKVPVEVSISVGKDWSAK
ncbi:hypothetical protein E9840_11220 [Tissierella creatinini]|nr:hypothetical protein E9840_11220 [Tissierella creatinini]TJX62905.1 hypothetical protein E8P77_16275 [Soehngenia saccharolytica]